jgi:hypothetical protein
MNEALAQRTWVDFTVFRTLIELEIGAHLRRGPYRA